VLTTPVTVYVTMAIVYVLVVVRVRMYGTVKQLVVAHVYSSGGSLWFC